jgi:hypothetical protein
LTLLAIRESCPSALVKRPQNFTDLLAQLPVGAPLAVHQISSVCPQQPMDRCCAAASIDRGQQVDGRGTVTMVYAHACQRHRLQHTLNPHLLGQGVALVQPCFA